MAMNRAFIESVVIYGFVFVFMIHFLINWTTQNTREIIQSTESDVETQIVLKETYKSILNYSMDDFSKNSENVKFNRSETDLNTKIQIMSQKLDLIKLMLESVNSKHETFQNFVNNFNSKTMFSPLKKDVSVPVYEELPQDLQPCPEFPKELVGREKVEPVYHRLDYLEKKFDAEMGGRWRPKTCKALRKVAIILPYRDRDTHLKIFLLNIIPKLQRQLVDYTIYVVEQAPGSTFNRGMMRNIGFAEASKLGEYDCFIFNDVDTIIEDDKNLYRCPKSKKVALHMASDVDRFGYRLAYQWLIGGILSIRGDQFREVNGYSNGYFLWGAEDDDLYRRLKIAKIGIERPPNKFGTVTTLTHERDVKSEKRIKLYSKLKGHSQKDGLNSLRYDVLNIEFRKLYTWIYVSIDQKVMTEITNKITNSTEEELTTTKPKE